MAARSMPPYNAPIQSDEESDYGNNFFVSTFSSPHVVFLSLLINFLDNFVSLLLLGSNSGDGMSDNEDSNANKGRGGR